MFLYQWKFSSVTKHPNQTNKQMEDPGLLANSQQQTWKYLKIGIFVNWMASFKI